MVKIKMDEKQIVGLLGKLSKYVSNAQSSGLWSKISQWLHGVIWNMFKSKGGQYGRPVWPGIGESMYGKKRWGSDGSDQGVYGAGSKPLEASGNYKKSFQQKATTPTNYVFGSVAMLADRIPYGGWTEGIGRKGAAYVKRYALPDPHSSQFQTEISEIRDEWLMDGIKQAMAGGS